MYMAVSFMLMLARLNPASVVAPPGEAVVRSAYNMYAGKWFKTAEWVQRTTQRGAPRPETWYTTLSLPGMLRYDVAPGATRRAVIYRNDSSYSFGDGKLRESKPDVQPLFVLLHDLHSAKPEKTIAMLKFYEFDLNKTHEQTWIGEKVIVVGALAGDTISNQFWLEKKRMVMVRLIEKNASDPRRPLDAQISGYEQVGGGWLERRVALYLGREPSVLYEYTDVVANPTLEAGIFEPLPYRLPAWVNGAKDIFGHLPNIALPGH